MTTPDWLAHINPPPPEELVTAMRNAVDDSLETPTADDLLVAAERLLDKVMRTDCETRSSAIDLLTVDALMTHALLIATDNKDTPDDFPERAVARITSAWK
jgi:hypothetical protein